MCERREDVNQGSFREGNKFSSCWNKRERNWFEMLLFMLSSCCLCRDHSSLLRQVHDEFNLSLCHFERLSIWIQGAKFLFLAYWLRVNLININSIAETCLWAIPLPNHPCFLFHSESFPKYHSSFVISMIHFYLLACILLFCFDTLKPGAILVSLTSHSFLKRLP